MVGQVNFALSAASSQWGINNQGKNAETTGSVAKLDNSDPLFKQRNTETTGAVAMFNGMNGADQGGRFCALA